jgi:hypothetical protein
MQLANAIPVTAQFAPAMIGMSVTEVMYTDRWVYTVIAVSQTGKTATIQLNRRVGPYSASGYYQTEPDIGGIITKIRLTKNGWHGMGRKFLMNVADAYLDVGY